MQRSVRVHPVEKLYGQAPAATVKNAHCATCIRCTAICADSTRAMGPLIGKYHRWRTPAACLLVGGFPGYIWGWFHIADDARLTAAFALPFGGMCASLAGYLALIAALPRTRHALVARAFAAAAISTYYWYRLPSLIGLGLFPGEGRLVDLSEIVAGDAILVLQVTVTAFWGWWLVVRRPSRSWQGRRLRERVWLAGRFRFGLGPPASDLDFRLRTSDFVFWLT